MGKINLAGKKIRLFFDQDLDGAVGASLISLFSGATVVKYIPAFAGFPKPEKMASDILDVFVDCRARNRDEDIRIDHHGSNEEKSYLEREGILVDTSFSSAVSLVAKYLEIKVHPQILAELDKADSGKKNVFTKFMIGNETFHKILINPGLEPKDYDNYELFKDKILSFMEKGFAIEDLEDTPFGYEQQIRKKLKVVVEDVKKKRKPLIKLVHTPTTSSLFVRNLFKMTDTDFYNKVLPYARQHYYEESIKGKMGVYVIIGFRRMNSKYDNILKKVITNDHPEPFQIFVSRSGSVTTINLGQLIQSVKEQTGITNGGGRDDVGGLNTNDRKKAIRALRLITDAIREQCP